MELLKKVTEEYKNYSRTHNLRLQSAFALGMSFFCFILWIDNEVPIFPPQFENYLNYYNVSSVFCLIFFLDWVFLKLAKRNKQLLSIAIWLVVASSFIFMDFIAFLDMGRGNGLTAIALGYLTIAVILSTNFISLCFVYLFNGVMFYYFASLMDGVDISEYKMSIVFITALSIFAFFVFEQQRRQVFESQQQLSKKIDELNNALNVKSIFYGHIIHELRTPLNAILGFSDMILSDTYRPKTIEKIKEYTGFIQASGAHLLNLVNEMLDSTKIEKGEFKLNFETINLGQSLQKYIDELSAISNNKNLKVCLIEESPIEHFKTDKKILKQIMFNLISNAQKFTKKGGKIDILTKYTENDFIEISVKDNGKGMDEKILKSIQDQKPSSKSYFITSEDGTGFGLIIVRQLVRMLGGDIIIKSIPAEGTEIRMIFPNTL